MNCRELCQDDQDQRADVAGRTQYRRDWLAMQRAVVAMGRRAIASPEVSVLVQDAAALLAEMLEADGSGVAEISPDGKRLLVRLARTASAADDRQGMLCQWDTSGSDSLAGYVLQVAHPVMVTDLAGEKRFVDHWLRKHGIQSAVAAPLTLPDCSFGSLAAYSQQTGYFDEDDLPFVETIAHLVATAVGRSHAEKSLAEERRLFSGLLETVDALVLMLDSQWQIVHMNSACERITGFSLAEIQRRSMWSVFGVGAEAQTFGRILADLQANAAPVDYESDLITKHSNRRRIAWSFGAILDNDDAVERILATGIDITAQHEAKQKLRPLEPMPVPPSGERRRRPRRSYPYMQMIAPIIDGKLPARDQFFEIKCNDVAAGGFSFVSPQPPSFESVVVALGIPPKITCLIAQVAHVTRIKHDGQRMFLIGCSYTGRMES